MSHPLSTIDLSQVGNSLSFSVLIEMMRGRACHFQVSLFEYILFSEFPVTTIIIPKTFPKTSPGLVTRKPHRGWLRKPKTSNLKPHRGWLWTLNTMRKYRKPHRVWLWTLNTMQYFSCTENTLFGCVLYCYTRALMNLFCESFQSYEIFVDLRGNFSLQPLDNQVWQ